MAEKFDSPFKDSIVPKGSEAIKGNYGNDPTGKQVNGSGVDGQAKPVDFSIDTFQYGTPKQSKR